MAISPLPPVEVIRNAVNPDFDAGLIYWLPRDASQFKAIGHKSAEACAQTWNTRFAGQLAFNVLHNSGYRQGTFYKRHLYAHRVLWALYHGEWPDAEIDHINCNPGDNRICNLRLVTSSQNKRNRTKSTDMSRGLKGVWRVGNRYRAAISAERHNIHLGYFDTQRDALIAYDMAARLIDGEYARVNLGGV